MRKLLFNNKLSQNGFTLLELIVVFTVIAILSTVGLASFVNYSRAQVLQQAYSDLLNTLNTAKSNAFSQVKPPQCASYTLEGYSVSINTSTWKSYSLNAICSGNKFVVSTTNLKDVTINNSAASPPTTIPGNPPTVFFSLLTGGVIGAGNIVLSGNGNTKTITITNVGGVQ